MTAYTLFKEYIWLMNTFIMQNSHTGTGVV